MTVHIITKNPGKRLAAESAFKKYGIAVKFIDKEYPEIQADTSLEIAKFTAVEAAKELGIPVVREDHSLFINALGIPGPYTSFIEKHLPVEKLLKVLEMQEDRSGYFEIATVYAEPDGFIKKYVYKVPVSFKKEIKVQDPRGGWNGIIRLKGEERAFTEYPEEERLSVWNKNYALLGEFLKSRNRV